MTLLPLSANPWLACAGTKTRLAQVARALVGGFVKDEKPAYPLGLKPRGLQPVQSLSEVYRN